MNDLSYWLKKAKEEGFAIGAFNVGNLETFKAVVAAAENQNSPVIIESSENETEYFGADNLIDLIDNARDKTGLPIFANLDHTRHFENIKPGIEAGYNLIHYDGSRELPDKNLATLKDVVELAHSNNVLVEGELDYIIEGSEVRKISAAEGLSQSNLTDPDKAADFVRESGTDLFAVSVGNVHGLYRTPKKIDIELLKNINEKVSAYLTLHGASGISDDQIRQAIEIGRIVKINISTELRQALRQELEKGLKDQPNEMAIYKITPSSINRMQEIIEAKMRLFGSNGKGGKDARSN